MVQIINSHQSQPSLQKIHSYKLPLATANHKPGKPDMTCQHAKVKSDKPSQHARYRQAIPTCIAKFIVYKGLQKPRTADKQRQQNSCGSSNWQSDDNGILGS